jgi:4-amino-4-deoxy-L-arabinose transferase-like glycosyltransferase
MSAVAQPAASRPAARVLAPWWPLAALTLLAAALRLSTLDLQSFWYDEAFTPVHVLHQSLSATMRAVSRTENSPPLWYLLEWVDYRILGSGEVALRLPSALAGIATVPVGWAIGQLVAGRRAAIASAALVAVNPLFVWYSQEARVYGLFVLSGAIAILCFLRFRERPSAGRGVAFAAAGVLALATHYFAVFMLAAMALWLLGDPASRRACLAPLAAIGAAGLALLPLIIAQGGHGTQWIGSWPLAERLQAIPQYYLTGYSGAPLGHGVELLVALPVLAAAGLGVWRMFEVPAKRPEWGREAPARAGAGTMLAIAAAGVLFPLVLAVLGADYLAPRNLVAAMIPVTVLIAVLGTWPRTGSAGVIALVLCAVGFLVITLDVDLSPRLQRGNWRELARLLSQGPGPRAVTTVELGSAPLEYYVAGLHYLQPGSLVKVREILETGYRPLRASAGEPPAPGFHLLGRREVDGLIVYRFAAVSARAVTEAELRSHVITSAHPEVLVPEGVTVAR